MDKRNQDSGRAVAPIIGVALMIGLAVLLSAAIGVFAIEMAQSEPDTDFLEIEQMNGESQSEAEGPGVEWEIERSGSFVTITHAGGEPVDASSVNIFVDGEEIDGFESVIGEGDSTMEYAMSETTVEVIWFDGNGYDLVLERATV